MTRDRALHTTALIAAAGGAAWLAKFAVIVAASGDTTDGGPTAVFYLLGVALMCVGAATITLRVLPAGRVWTALAILAAPFVAILSYMLLDAVAKAIAGDAGPAWLNDEVGIALTGAVWLAVGLWFARRPALEAVPA